MEAQGYSRISGKIGVALVTTGGGTSNAVTGILSAYLDSVPVLIISGNESSFHCSNVNNLRAYGVQGFDSVSVLKPITKSTIRIVDARDTKNITEKMISKALTARMGPTHCCGPNSEIAVRAIQAAMNRYSGLSIALKLAIAELASALGCGNACPKNITA
jgi:acetolactate synthase-1/2/3 large subunit